VVGFDPDSGASLVLTGIYFRVRHDGQGDRLASGGEHRFGEAGFFQQTLLGGGADVLIHADADGAGARSDGFRPGSGWIGIGLGRRKISYK
jgi:hypothetical protein